MHEKLTKGAISLVSQEMMHHFAPSMTIAAPHSRHRPSGRRQHGNGRPGHERATRGQQATVDRVHAAAEPRLADEAARRALSRAALRVDVVISKFGGFANELLAKAFHALAPGLGIEVTFVYPAAMTPEAYVNALEHCRGREATAWWCRRWITEAFATPWTDRRGWIPVITVLTGLPGSGVLGYAGSTTGPPDGRLASNGTPVPEAGRGRGVHRRHPLPQP